MAALDADGAPLMVMPSVLAGSVADGSPDMSMSSVLAGNVAEDSPEMDMSSVTESSGGATVFRQNPEVTRSSL